MQRNSENRDGGKPLRDLTRLTTFFLQKMFFTQKNGLILIRIPMENFVGKQLHSMTLKFFKNFSQNS